MKVTTETKALAQQIYDWFLVYPERHSQDEWVSIKGDLRGVLTDENICNTTMCVAGTAVFLAQGNDGINQHVGRLSDTAARLLGLSAIEADELFFCMDNQAARDAVAAIAAGDKKKFKAILEAVEED